MGDVWDIDVRSQKTVSDEYYRDNRQGPSHDPSRHVDDQDNQEGAQNDVYPGSGPGTFIKDVIDNEGNVSATDKRPDGR